MGKKRNKHFITNGLEERFVNIDSELPLGWKIGRSDTVRAKISNTEKGKAKSEHQKQALKIYWNKERNGKHWYNNGESDGLFEPGKEPPGWVLGQSKSRKIKNSRVNKGKKMSPESAIKRVKTRRKNNSYFLAPESRKLISIALKGRKRKRESIQKALITKRKNSSFSASKSQEILQNLFVSLYSDTQIEYNKDNRYPYSVDVYIPRFDLFIEFNGHWTHGPHPFNPHNPEDLKLLDKWKNKQRTYTSKNGTEKKNSYYIAEKVWTVTDLEKINCAKKNNLNYLVLYNTTNLDYIEIFTSLAIEKYITGINIIDMKDLYDTYCDLLSEVIV